MASTVTPTSYFPLSTPHRNETSSQNPLKFSPTSPAKTQKAGSHPHGRPQNGVSSSSKNWSSSVCAFTNQFSPTLTWPGIRPLIPASRLPTLLRPQRPRNLARNRHQSLGGFNMDEANVIPHTKHHRRSTSKLASR